MKNIVSIDIDDTLLNFAVLVQLVASNEFNLRIPAEPEQWEMALHPLTDFEVGTKIFRRAHDKEFLDISTPLIGSVEGVNEIFNMGYEVVYVSDRKQESAAYTSEWLERHGFPNPEMLVCGPDKRVYLTDIKDELFTLIDDRPRTLAFGVFTLNLEHVFGIEYAYNRAVTDIHPGVHLDYSWVGLMDKFKKVVPSLAL